MPPKRISALDLHILPYEFIIQVHSWQLPDSMKQSQADLYLETYQVLDLEMSRLREIQRWQASASSKVWLDNHLFSSHSLIFFETWIWFILMQLAADMQRFSRPERRINGPTITHLWFVRWWHHLFCPPIKSSYMISFTLYIIKAVCNNSLVRSWKFKLFHF